MTFTCRNPNKADRPKFRTIHLSLLDNKERVLAIPQEAIETHQLAGVLGSPLSAGEKMYSDLAKQYEEVVYYDII